MGVRVIHSSAYNPQSMGLVDRVVRTLKELLRKNSNLSQLKLSELVYAVNCRENREQGCAMSKFIGRGTRSNLPNSWDRSVNWQQQIQLRGKERKKRVKKKERIVGKKEIFEIGKNVKH